MDFFKSRQNSTIYTDLAVIRHLTLCLPMIPILPVFEGLTLCLPPARWGPGTLDSLCSGNIAWFRWISFNFIKTWLSIRPLKCQNQPFVSHLLAENPGPLIPSVVAQISMDFFKSRQDYLYRFSRNPTPCPSWPFVSHLLAEDPRHLIL